MLARSVSIVESQFRLVPKLKIPLVNRISHYDTHNRRDSIISLSWGNSKVFSRSYGSKSLLFTSLSRTSTGLSASGSLTNCSDVKVPGIKIQRVGTITASRLASTFASIEEKFTSEDLENILKTINDTNSPEDFKRFVISKKKIDELVKKKNSNGSIESIDELISIIGVKSLNRFFCSVLDRPSQNVSNPIFPILTPEQIDATSKVLSVSVVGGRISWCVISRQRNGHSFSFVLESLVQVPYLYKPKMHFLTMLNEMNDISSQVPTAQFCLVEEYPNSLPNSYMFTFQLQMAQMRSFFLGSLIARPNPPQVVSIKSIAVARLFNTYVGSERVSGQHLVDNMITFKPLPSLIVPESAKMQYESAESKDKEGMSSVFLLNLGYWKLTKQFIDVH